MATIDSKKIILQIINNNGFYEEDNRVYQIVEYMNAWGNITWGVTWDHESSSMKHRYETETEYVRNPKIIWRAD